MRHLFVTNDFPPKTGGIESYLTTLCAGFDPDDVTVVAPERDGFEGVDTFLPYEVVRVPQKYMRASAGVARRVVTAGRARRVDVVHFLHALPLGRLGRRVRRDLGVPYTVVAHGSEVLVPGRLPFVRSALRGVLSSADLVLCVSDYTKRAVDRISKGRAASTILYPPVDVVRFSLAVSGADVRTRFRIGSSFTVLFVGRLVKRKGAEILVRALERVPDAVVLIVGTGPEEAAVKRVAEELEVADRVRFCGHVPDTELPRYYAASDVFCMPCTDRYGGVDTEGFGIVYMEAQASGIPCVAGACGGSVEAVVDGATGIVLVDPSPASVARALTKLKRDDLLRTRMGAAGRDRAEQEFAPAVQALKLERSLVRVARTPG